MPMFNNREGAIEQEFEHEQELRFEQIAKRNKLFGLSAAERMGLGGAEAEAYATSVVGKEIVGHGDAAVIGKIMKDLAAAGRPVAGRQILSHLKAFDAQARGEIAKHSQPAD